MSWRFLSSESPLSISTYFGSRPRPLASPSIACKGLFLVSTVARLKEKWHAEGEIGRQQRLDDLQVVYLWMDGIYMKAWLEKDRAALLVVIAGLADSCKVVVAATPWTSRVEGRVEGLGQSLPAGAASSPAQSIGL